MDKTELERLGLIASDKFVQEHVELNDTIAKFAKEYDLTDQQIQRVIEIANNLTYMSLLNTSEDKDITFPVASLDKVSSILSLKTPIKKQASAKPINYELMSDEEPNISPMDALIKEAVKMEQEYQKAQERDYLLDEYEMLKQAREFVNQKLWDLDNRYSELASKVASEFIRLLTTKTCTKDDLKNMLSTVNIKTANDIATQFYQQIQDNEYVELDERKRAMTKEDATPITSQLEWLNQTNEYSNGWRAVGELIDNKIKQLEEKGIKI